MTNLKTFEKKETEWWCNYYRISARDLAKRTREFLNGEIDKGLLEAILVAVENDMEMRDKRD